MNQKDVFKILFLGDIVGRPGRFAIAKHLPEIRKEFGIDYVIANGENLSAGNGITYNKYQDMINVGVDYFTSGNHIWNNQDIIPHLDEPSTHILRPANYSDDAPGRGYVRIKVKDVEILLINLQGRVFMKDDIEDPFVLGKNIIDDNKKLITIIDFHAEATSEKRALAYYLEGMATAIIGTHTHVPTADEEVLPGGTAFISDVGMCGPRDSVLGVKKEIIIEKFLTQLPQSHKVAKGDSVINGVFVTIDKKTKKAVNIERYTKIVKASYSIIYNHCIFMLY